MSLSNTIRKMGKTTLTLIIAFCLCITTFFPAWISPAQASAPASPDRNTVILRLRAVEGALNWLQSAQNPDGGFGAGGVSAPLTTAIAVQGILVAHLDPWTVISTAGQTPIDYLESYAGDGSGDAYHIAHMILAAIALGQDPAGFAGQNWPALLDATLGGDGRYASVSATPVETQAVAIRALRSLYRPVPTSAITWLKNSVKGDGGWGPPGPTSDTYHTALAMQALLFAGEPASSSHVVNARNYLQARRLGGGGFAASPGGSSSDLAATAIAVQALAAAGERLLATPWTTQGRSPFDALLVMQHPDGAFAWTAGGSADVEATGTALCGLIAPKAPLRERHHAARQALVWLRSQQRADGGFGAGANPSGSMTSDAVYAIAVAGQDPAGSAWTPAGTSALAALEALTPAYVGAPPYKAAEAGKVARAAANAGRDSRSFGGIDLIQAINANYNPSTGRYHEFHLFWHLLSMDGLLAAGEAVPTGARQTVAADQGPNGGWKWAFGGSNVPDVDTTGLAMRVLVDAGLAPHEAPMRRALQFLFSMQLPDGSFPDLAGVAIGNSDSSALAIQGITSAGFDPRDRAFTLLSPEGTLTTPLGALFTLQEDSGAFKFTESIPESRLRAVLDVVPALVAEYPATRTFRSGFLPLYVKG